MPDNYHSLMDILIERAVELPEKNACVFVHRNGITEDKITYAQLDKQARAIAEGIQQLGIKQGERVLFIFSPGMDFIRAFFACTSLLVCNG